MTTPRTETGGPTRTPRSEIKAVIPAARREEVGVEPVHLWDTSESTNWPAAPGGKDWPDPTSRRHVMVEASRLYVAKIEGLDTEARGEQAGGSDAKGGELTFFFGSHSSKGFDLNSSNFQRTIDGYAPSWGGGTRIMPAWEQALEEYDSEFGDRPQRDRPVHAVRIGTDGELEPDDRDEFAKVLLTANAHRVFLVCVFGYDEDPANPLHTKCLDMYRKIAAQQHAADPHGKSYITVVSFDSVTDPTEVAEDMVTLLS